MEPSSGKTDAMSDSDDGDLGRASNGAIEEESYTFAGCCFMFHPETYTWQANFFCAHLMRTSLLSTSPSLTRKRLVHRIRKTQSAIHTTMSPQKVPRATTASAQTATRISRGHVSRWFASWSRCSSQPRLLNKAKRDKFAQLSSDIRRRCHTKRARATRTWHRGVQQHKTALDIAEKMGDCNSCMRANVVSKLVRRSVWYQRARQGAFAGLVHCFGRERARRNARICWCLSAVVLCCGW